MHCKYPKKARRLLGIILSFIVLCTLLGIWLLNGSYPAGTAAHTALQSDDLVTVTQSGNLTVFAPKEYTRGFIFYPGGRVEHLAYAPLLRAMAENGLLCVLVEMPFDLAILNGNAAEDIPAAFPAAEDWMIGGHSLGGVMASDHAAKHPDLYSALLLLASYSTQDLSASDIEVVSLYGENDGVLNLENYEANKVHLPADRIEYVIPGGNHALFGDYGAQRGDGTAAITAQEQIAAVIAHLPAA